MRNHWDYPSRKFTCNSLCRERKKREKAEAYQKREREEAAAKAEADRVAAEAAARAAEDAADAKKIRAREKKAMQKERSRFRAICAEIGKPSCYRIKGIHKRSNA